MTSPFRTGALCALLIALLAGCGTTVVSGTATPVGAAAPPATPSSSGSAGAAPIDVCSFFTAAEVKKLIGSAPPGRPSAVPDGGSCTWEDTENYFSLTVDIGETDTAINGTLPPWDPALGPERKLPNGMRDINGSVEFVCGGTRLCSVQVATNKSSTDVRTGVGLVPTIRAKVGG